MAKIIFLGAGPTALAGIREVGEYGFDTYAIGLDRYEVGLYSKYSKSLGVYSPYNQKDELLKMLKEFSSKKDEHFILIPTGDEFIEFLSQNRDELSSYNYNFSLLKNDTSEIFLNKERFYKLCQKTSTPAPKTWIKDSTITLTEFANRALYPCFIKPIYYHKWAKIYGLKKGFLVSNRDELLQRYSEVSKNISDLIVQEVIEGDDSNIVVFTANFSKNSNPKEIFTARKKRQYPVGFGTTTAAVSEDIDEIKDYAIKILKEVDFSGVCDVEFKFDKRDNLYKIIEINPRIGRWYRLVTKSGKIPLVSSILDMIDKEDNRKELKQRNNLFWLFPIRDIPAIIKQKKLDRLKEYIKLAKVWCIWDRRDTKPFFIYFFEMASKLYKQKRKK